MLKKARQLLLEAGFEPGHADSASVNVNFATQGSVTIILLQRGTSRGELRIVLYSKESFNDPDRKDWYILV